MKRMLTLLIVALSIGSACQGACTQQIKNFYKAYLQNVAEDDSKNAELCQTRMTEALVAKMERVGRATGADPVIRAQDANEDALETLEVKELGDDWYMVTYLWKKGDNTTLTQIPLKAQEVDGVCKITYITPIWNGSRYGNDSLPCRAGRKQAVSEASEASFLQSFYNAYTAAYCAMPRDLNAELAPLRERYLSERAFTQFREAEAEKRADGLPGYDKLIDHFDFDCLWCKSLRITPLQHESEYEVSYQVADKPYRMVVTVEKQADGYRIADLRP